VSFALLKPPERGFAQLLKLGVHDDQLNFAVKLLEKSSKQSGVDYHQFMSFFQNHDSVYRPTER
jgi:hypothetical protein